MEGTGSNMTMLYTATLGGVNLPTHFRYQPHIPRKRTSTMATANAVVTQAASPVIVHGDGTLAWSIEAAFASEFQILYNQYNTTSDTLLTFNGYWGEVFEVYFRVLDEPSVQGRLFSLSGMFQVASITTHYTAACGPVI